MQPTPYAPSEDFSQDESNNVSGRSTVKTASLDAELGNISTTLTEILTNLAIIQRDDTRLMNDILQGHEFSGAAISYLASLIVGNNTVLVPRGAWVGGGTDYLISNLVEYGGNVYISLTVHTSAATSPDADSTNWRIFVTKGSDGGVPYRTGNANKVLTTDGVNDAWLFLTNKQINGITTDVSVAGVITVDLSTNFQHTLSLTENITSWVTSNRMAGRAVDIRVVSDASGPYTFPAAGAGFGADWKWMNGKPAQLAASKTAILSLRCYGALESDIVASIGTEL